MDNVLIIDNYYPACLDQDIIQNFYSQVDTQNITDIAVLKTQSRRQAIQSQLIQLAQDFHSSPSYDIEIIFETGLSE